MIIRHVGSFELGMYDPLNGRYEPLGRHPSDREARIVGDLKTKIEREGFKCTFSEKRAER